MQNLWHYVQDEEHALVDCPSPDLAQLHNKHQHFFHTLCSRSSRLRESTANQIPKDWLSLCMSAWTAVPSVSRTPPWLFAPALWVRFGCRPDEPHLGCQLWWRRQKAHQANVSLPISNIRHFELLLGWQRPVTNKVMLVSGCWPSRFQPSCPHLADTAIFPNLTTNQSA